MSDEEMRLEEAVEQEHFAAFQQQREDAEAYRHLRARAGSLGYPTISHALDALEEGAAHEPGEDE